jgi:hypothetical protein
MQSRTHLDTTQFFGDTLQMYALFRIWNFLVFPRSYYDQLIINEEMKTHFVTKSMAKKALSAEHFLDSYC